MVDQLIDVIEPVHPGARGERGETGPQGPQGLPGVNAVPADEAVATYIKDKNSKTHAALPAEAEYIAPSEDKTGVTDTQNIQQALDAGKAVVLANEGTYYCAQLVLHDRSYIEARNALIYLSEYNAIITDTFNPDITLTGANTAPNSNVITVESTDKVSTGMMVSMLGAGHGVNAAKVSDGTYLYGSITAKTDKSITVSVPAFNTVSNGIVNVFTRRIQNVTIHGGRWYQTAGLVQSHDNNVSIYNGLAFVFRRVDYLRISDAEFQVSTKLGQTSGRYTLSLGDIRNAYLNNIFLNTTAGDGIHLHGPAYDSIISNITASNVGDDVVALGTLDGSSPRINDTSGDIAGITITNIHSNGGSWSSVKLFDRLEWAFTSEKNTLYKFNKIFISDISGDYKTQNISLEANAHIGTIVIDRDYGVPPAGNPSVNVTSPYVLNLIIRDSRWRKASSTGTQPYLKINTPHNLTIENMTIDTINSLNGNDMVLVYEADVNAATNTSIRIDGIVSSVRWPMSLLNINKCYGRLNVEIANVRDIWSTGSAFLYRPDKTDTKNVYELQFYAHDIIYGVNVAENPYDAYFVRTNATLRSSRISRVRLLGNPDTIYWFLAENQNVYGKPNAVLDVTFDNILDWSNHQTIGARMLGVLFGDTQQSLVQIQAQALGINANIEGWQPILGHTAVNSNDTLSCGTGLVIADGSKWINAIDHTKTYTPPTIYPMMDAILFFGDSITYGKNASSTEKRYSTLLASNLHLHEVNHAVSGATYSAGNPEGSILDQINQAKDSVTPRLVILAAGFNDVNRNHTIDEGKTGLTNAINAAKAKYPNTVIYAITGLAFAGDTTKDKRIAYWQELNKTAQTLGVKTIDAWTILSTPAWTTYDSGDHIHPNDDGHALIARNLAATISI